MISLKDLKALSSSLNILFVEDEEMLRDSMRGTLEKLFKNTFIASHGQEAIEIYKKEKIDLILTDINMPIMGGMELITKINEKDTNAMIIVLSAHNESKLLIKLINMEVNYFLTKPVEKDALIKILYKTCAILHDRKMFEEYSGQLENENNEVRRRNSVLELKLKQLASQSNELKALKTNKQDKVVQKDFEEESYYETLLQDDKDELKDLGQELETTIMIMFQNEGLNVEYTKRLASIYKRYASTLNLYIEFFNIGSKVSMLSEKIVSLEHKFLEDIHQTGVYLNSLQLTLESFRHNTWEHEAKNPKFYNASLENDIQLIIDFLEGRDAEDNEIEFF